MSLHEALLTRLGELIRARRVAAGLTQDALGTRAGIVGKYVSEIERGTRDVPLSTLRAIAEDGLGLNLDIRFQAKSPTRTRLRSALPRAVDEIAHLIAELPAEQRSKVLVALRAILAALGKT